MLAIFDINFVFVFSLFFMINRVKTLENTIYIRLLARKYNGVYSPSYLCDGRSHSLDHGGHRCHYAPKHIPEPPHLQTSRPALFVSHRHQYVSLFNVFFFVFFFGQKLNLIYRYYQNLARFPYLRSKYVIELLDPF